MTVLHFDNTQVVMESSNLTICCKNNDWHKIRLRCFNVILHLILFFVFMIYFGKPSVDKYLDKKTIVITTEEFTNGIEAPAISIVVMNNRSVPGWKSANETLNFESFSMFRHCQTLNFSDMYACKRNDTINLDDFLKTARIGGFEETSTLLSNSSSSAIWTEDMTHTYSGRVFTLKHTTIIKSLYPLVLEVNPGFEYHIWVHDENFFLANYNTFGLPSKFWRIPANKLAKEGLYHDVILTKQKKLNLDKNPCEENPFYSFSICIQGCKKDHFGWITRPGVNCADVCNSPSNIPSFQQSRGSQRVKGDARGVLGGKGDV